ncbi:unnamed protein product [Caretta caretta]
MPDPAPLHFLPRESAATVSEANSLREQSPAGAQKRLANDSTPFSENLFLLNLSCKTYPLPCLIFYGLTPPSPAEVDCSTTLLQHLTPSLPE